MPRRRCVISLALFLATATFSTADEPDLSDELPRIKPLSPAEGRASITTLPGYRIETTAAEPLVVDPVAMCFDEDGNAFVVEMRDYSEQDRAMLGRVRKLIDEDGDGHFDKSTVFAEGLSWPTAITRWDGGVFVAAPPHLFYLKDEDGDGVVGDEKSGERRIVYTGFSRSNVQGMTNSLRWGIDCRIHGATSTAGAKLTRPDDPDFEPVELRGRDFSFDPRNPSDLRPESGGGQHGMCFDDWGRKFVSSNSDHLQAILYEDRYAARNPQLKAPPARVSIAADGGQAPVFRKSPVEPWRIVRTRLRVAGEVPGPVEGGGTPAGYFTGATGVTIYRGDLMPELRGQAFVADVGSNLVHRKRITPKGTSFVGTRIDRETEFLASTDIWFRPVQLANGPDGTLHVLDMYREVIEHPKSLPPVIKRHLDLTSGRNRGRLYRVVPDRKVEPRPVKLSRASDIELVRLLDHENSWHRETASRLLVERGTPSNAVLHELRQLASEASPLGRVHALSLLDGFDRLDVDDLLANVAHDHPRVREVAVRLCGRFPNDAAVKAALLKRLADRDPRVRVQVAFSFGDLAVSAKSSPLAELLRRHGDEPLTRFAALSSLNDGGGTAFREMAFWVPFRTTPFGQDVLGQLAELIGRQGNPVEAGHVLAVLPDLPDEFRAPLTRRFATGLGASKSALRHQVGGTDARGYERALAGILDSARRKATSKGASEERLEAIRTLAIGNDGDAALLLGLLEVNEPEPVQLVALDTLGSLPSRRTVPVLLEKWSMFTPAVRRAAAERLVTDVDGLAAYLTAIEQAKIPRAEVDVGRLELAKTVSDADRRRRIDAVLTKIDPGKRADVIERYRAALDLDGDPDRGRAVFRKNCATCHRLEDHGHAIGPNLATIRNRGDESIVVNVFDPNREVNPEFLEYVAVDRDGRQHMGMLISQTATSLVLKRAEGKETSLLRSDVEILKSSGRSLMPEGLEKEITVESMADLLTYLRSTR